MMRALEAQFLMLPTHVVLTEMVIDPACSLAFEGAPKLERTALAPDIGGGVQTQSRVISAMTSWNTSHATAATAAASSNHSTTRMPPQPAACGDSTNGRTSPLILVAASSAAASASSRGA